MNRFVIPAVCVAVLAFVCCPDHALAQSIAAATPSPAPSATPGKTSTVARLRKLYKAGAQFASFGIAPAANIQSEFHPGSTSAQPSLDIWQTGEARVIGIEIVSYNDYRAFTYDHQTSDPVTTIGGGGSTIVPAFSVFERTFTTGFGIGVVRHVFVGVGTLRRQTNTGYPPTHGIAFNLIVTPNTHTIVSPYGLIAYAPNVGGNYTLAAGNQTDLSYRAWTYRAGIVVREPGTRYFVDAGFAGEALNNRTNAPAAIRSSQATLGFGLRY